MAIYIQMIKRIIKITSYKYSINMGNDYDALINDYIVLIDSYFQTIKKINEIIMHGQGWRLGMEYLKEEFIVENIDN